MGNRFDILSQQLLQKDISMCSVEELQQFSQQFPFFAPAQFLFLEKLKQESAPDYHQQLQKVSLYFHDHVMFQFFINKSSIDTDLTEINIENEEQEQEISTGKEWLHKAKNEEFIEEPEEIVEIKKDVEFEKQATEQEILPIPETSEIENVKEPDNEYESDQEPEKKEVFSEIENNQKQSTAGINLTFEPFHTVDYFASQGIKLSQEDVGKDSFSNQLKSFTEWLRTMKRLPASEQLNKLDPHAEEKVENIAAHSVDSSEILTETMAEVWVKQGKLEKAIEVYNKLSLLNPSKRSYFAAKLENLKKAI